MEEEDNSAMNYSVLRQTIQHVLRSSLFGGAVHKKVEIVMVDQNNLKETPLHQTRSD